MAIQAAEQHLNDMLLTEKPKTNSLYVNWTELMLGKIFRGVVKKWELCVFLQSLCTQSSDIHNKKEKYMIHNVFYLGHIMHIS